MAKTLLRRKRLNWRDRNYPKHLAGRLFSIVVHGDAEGIVEVKRALSDWLTSMDLKSAGPTAELSRYIGYLKPYATSHEDLDRDKIISGRGSADGFDLDKGSEGQTSTAMVSAATQKYECRVRNEY